MFCVYVASLTISGNTFNEACLCSTLQQIITGYEHTYMWFRLSDWWLWLWWNNPNPAYMSIQHFRRIMTLYNHVYNALQCMLEVKCFLGAQSISG